MGITICALQAQTLDLRGRVVAKGAPVADAMPVSVGNAGSYFLRMRLGGETITHPFVQSGSGAAGTVFAPALRVAAKEAAVVDTLIIRKAGYQAMTSRIGFP